MMLEIREKFFVVDRQGVRMLNLKLIYEKVPGISTGLPVGRVGLRMLNLKRIYQKLPVTGCPVCS